MMKPNHMTTTIREISLIDSIISAKWPNTKTKEPCWQSTRANHTTDFYYWTYSQWPSAKVTQLFTLVKRSLEYWFDSIIPIQWLYSLFIVEIDTHFMGLGGGGGWKSAHVIWTTVYILTHTCNRQYIHPQSKNNKTTTTENSNSLTRKQPHNIQTETKALAKWNHMHCNKLIAAEKWKKIK